MKALDPRLLGESRAARLWVTLVVAAGVVNGALAILAAWVLSRVLADAVQHKAALAAVRPMLVLLAGLVLGRGAAMWLSECAGHAGAREVIAGLRARLLRVLADEGPALVRDQRSGPIATAATTGIDALDVYFARYLPQLVLGAVIPIMVLTFLLATDVVSALIVVITLPLIPLFMWLIGSAAQHRMDARWRLLQRLAAYFLDVIQGLPTLRIFGRAEIQVDRVRAMTEASRRATMGTLSIAFLSSMVLESLASIATALVAAAIGLRLVGGSMTLQTGLAVLIVVPEAYMPLRQLGTFYHSSKEGLTAAMTILDLIETARTGQGTATDACSRADGTPRPSSAGPRRKPPTRRGAVATGASPRATSLIEFSNVTCIYDGRGEGIAAPLTLSIMPRTTTLIYGASGAGKSTLLALLVPFMPCTGGSIRVGGLDLNELDSEAWRRQIGWVPQHPSLFAGTVLDNIRIGAPDVSEVEAAALLGRLFPDGTISPATSLTEDGEGLSGGERTRVALARSVLRSPSLLLLDEPTAFLDPRAASAVLTLLERLSEMTTLVIATHEPERFPWADQAINLDAGALDAASLKRIDARGWAGAGP